MWFIGVEVEQETSAPPPKKNPASAPALHYYMGAPPLFPLVTTIQYNMKMIFYLRETNPNKGLILSTQKILAWKCNISSLLETTCSQLTKFSILWILLATNT